jgi:outer membrane protein assembly factor BamD (BamD/ComL family)
MFDAHGHAMSQYESIRLNDPTGPLADDATFAAGVSNFLHHHYEEADQHFDTLRKEYPRSEHQADAHLLGIRAKLRNYQGAEYDERPILEADKLIDSTIRQFGREMPDERERLVRAQRAIRAQRAEREFVNGQYYDHHKAYGAAKFYYNNLVKQWPETQHAHMAQERLAEIKDFPDDPPNYWGWLGKIFGERKKSYR